MVTTRPSPTCRFWSFVHPPTTLLQLILLNRLPRNCLRLSDCLKKPLSLSYQFLWCRSRSWNSFILDRIRSSVASRFDNENIKAVVPDSMYWSTTVFPVKDVLRSPVHIIVMAEEAELPWSIPNLLFLSCRYSSTGIIPVIHRIRMASLSTLCKASCSFSVLKSSSKPLPNMLSALFGWCFKSLDRHQRLPFLSQHIHVTLRWPLHLVVAKYPSHHFQSISKSQLDMSIPISVSAASLDFGGLLILCLSRNAAWKISSPVWWWENWPLIVAISVAWLDQGNSSTS